MLPDGMASPPRPPWEVGPPRSFYACLIRPGPEAAEDIGWHDAQRPLSPSVRMAEDGRLDRPAQRIEDAVIDEQVSSLDVMNCPPSTPIGMIVRRRPARRVLQR
jgi:hypothetical protein